MAAGDEPPGGAVGKPRGERPVVGEERVGGAAAEPDGGASQPAGPGEDVVAGEVGRPVERIGNGRRLLRVGVPDGGARDGDRPEPSRVALGGEQRAVAAHRPPHGRPRLEPEGAAQERQEVGDQHAHAVLAVGAPVPVALAAVDGRDGEAQAGCRDEVDGVEAVHHPVGVAAAAGQAHRRCASRVPGRQADGPGPRPPRRVRPRRGR
ncbi:MAG TPA: hypothetical protein VGJ11_05225 [Gaiellales bacterium]